MDELQKAIKTARDVHDRSEDMSRTHVTVGALIRAVELLAEATKAPVDVSDVMVERVAVIVG